MTPHPALVPFGKLLPVNADTKRPLLPEVTGFTSNEQCQIDNWELQYPGCGWAMKIDSYILIVLDLERPGKGSDEGGLFHVRELEKIYGSIPPCPKARSQHGGEHWYFFCPPEFIGQIHNWNSALTSVDCRTGGDGGTNPTWGGGNVLLPPSCGRQWITTIEEVPIPYLPAWVCEQIIKRKGHSAQSKEKRVQSGTVTPPTTTKTERKERRLSANDIIVEHIPKRVWCRIRRAHDFKPLWYRCATMLEDQSTYSYEYYLAKLAYRNGLTDGQVTGFVMAWWASKGITGKIRRFLNKVRPDAWDDEEPFVLKWRANHDANAEAKATGKTRNKIWVQIGLHGPATPAQIAKALGISRHCAVQACLRMKSLTSERGVYSLLSVPMGGSVTM